MITDVHHLRAQRSGIFAKAQRSNPISRRDPIHEGSFLLRTLSLIQEETEDKTSTARTSTLAPRPLVQESPRIIPMSVSVQGTHVNIPKFLTRNRREPANSHPFMRRALVLLSARWFDSSKPTSGTSHCYVDAAPPFPMVCILGSSDAKGSMALQRKESKSNMQPCGRQSS